MTIKEVENILDIPRATVRFYEKEGLINPTRADNGYRDYSENDVEILRKVVIFRKIGMSIEDISDVFDGARPMDEVLDSNIKNLEKQMKELHGAINLCKKMQEDHIDINFMDAKLYWNTITEEEKNGNVFMDIAKDIISVEKETFLSHFARLDEEGKPYDSIFEILRNAIIIVGIYGIIQCIINHSWTIKNFGAGIKLFISIILVECILMIPIYFMGRKNTWIRNNRKKTLLLVALTLFVIVIFAAINLL